MLWLAVQGHLEYAGARFITTANDWCLVYPTGCCRDGRLLVPPVEIFAFLISCRRGHLELEYFILVSLSYLFKRQLLISDYCLIKVALALLTMCTLKAPSLERTQQSWQLFWVKYDDTSQESLPSDDLKKNKLQLRVGVKLDVIICTGQCYQLTWQMWLNKANIEWTLTWPWVLDLKKCWTKVGVEVVGGNLI